MSFTEKSIWISLLSTLGIFTYYFVNIWQLADALGSPLNSINSDDASAALINAARGLSIQCIILIVIVEAIFHSVLAISNRRAAAMGADERDELLALKANRYGYSILVVSVLMLVGLQLWFNQNPLLNPYLSEPFIMGHFLLAAFILSEVVRFSAQLFYYRRGY